MEHLVFLRITKNEECAEYSREDSSICEGELYWDDEKEQYNFYSKDGKIHYDVDYGDPAGYVDGKYYDYPEWIEVDL